MKIPLEKIRLIRPEHRLSLDPEALRSLAADLKENAQIQPIAVRPLQTGEWELIAGRRRVEAARLNGWTEIEAYQPESESSAEMLALSENVKRADISALEESIIIQRFHVDLNMSIGEIAERTGHGHEWVQRRLEVAAFPEDVKKALHEKILSVSAAAFLAQVDDTEYRTWLLHCSKINGCTMHQAEAWWMDYNARNKMAATDGEHPNYAEPPPLPSRPLQPCFLCENHVDPAYAIVVRICPICLKAVQEEKQKAPNPTERPQEQIPPADPRSKSAIPKNGQDPS